MAGEVGYRRDLNAYSVLAGALMNIVLRSIVVIRGAKGTGMQSYPTSVSPLKPTFMNQHPWIPKLGGKKGINGHLNSGTVAGQIASNRDLNAQFGFGNASHDHSAQFNSRYSRRKAYWDAVLMDYGISP